MTCIIGLEHDGKVYMGADSMAASSWDMQITTLRKVFRVGAFLIGYTSSFRMGQILQYHLDIRQQQDGESDERYMVVGFIEAVRTCLKEKGFARSNEGEESGGEFLVGYHGHVYKVTPNFQVNHFRNNYVAAGAGEPYALGAMAALVNKKPRKRILKALKIAAQFSNGVCKPFYVEELS